MNTTASRCSGDSQSPKPSSYTSSTQLANGLETLNTCTLKDMVMPPGEGFSKLLLRPVAFRC